LNHRNVKKDIAIYGAGGLGREICTLIRTLSAYQLTGFYDDNISAGTEIMGLPVLGDVKSLKQLRNPMDVIVAIGNPRIKREVVTKLNNTRLISFPVLVHPQAIIQDPDTIRLGAGSIITAGVIITTQVTIGQHVLVNLNSTIGHDVTIGNFSSIMPGANIAGSVTLGESVLIGAGANVLNNLNVGDDCRVGAGAVVTKNVEKGSTVIGVPAKRMWK
jgi:sugar O-acyltransferase (sialic acid O-acetyltransferase NeuD family)